MDRNFLYLVFHGDTRELLRPGQQNGVVSYPLDRRAAIKDIIEAAGVPHTEVGGIICGGRELTFQSIPTGGERIDIYPFTNQTPVNRPTVLRPEPFTVLRFLVDINVAKLARNLRMVGIDAASVAESAVTDVALRAGREQRVVLTRNRDLLKVRTIDFGQLLRSVNPLEQLLEVVRRYGLQSHIRPFSRCLHCNEVLRPVLKTAIDHFLEPLTRKYYNDFKQCASCERVYWRGSHYAKMVAMVEKAMKELARRS
jgi:uncharacterized protein